MKKTLIAAAVAASFAAPAMADNTLYGNIGASFTSDTGVGDQTSWMGVKGSEDLGNGMSAIYKVEFNVTNDTTATFTKRDMFIGLKGSFGTIQIGDQNGPEKAVMFAGKIVENTFADRAGILGRGSSKTEGDYLPDALAYVSPTVNGFTAIAAVHSDGTTTNGDIDAKSFAVTYANGPLKVGYGMTDFDNDWSLANTGGATAATAFAGVDSWTLSASYAMGDLAVAASYQEVDMPNTSNDYDNYMVDVSYTMGNNVLFAVYGESDLANSSVVSTTADDKEKTLGVKHNLSKRTNVMAMYHDRDSNTTDGADFGVQLNHKF